MKKILIATDCFLPRWDGIARFLSELLPHLSEKFSITVLAPNFPGEKPHFRGVEVVYLPLHHFSVGDFPVARIPTLQILPLIEQCDLVFTQTIGPIGMKTISLAKKKGKPVIAYTHSIEWELVKNSLGKYNPMRAITNFAIKNAMRKAYGNCNLLLVPSEQMAGLLTITGITTKKKVVSLGIDTKKFAPPLRKADAKKKIGISRDRVIGYCGRIGREKDLATLLQAFRLVRLLHQDVTLLIVGDGLPSLRRDFEKQAGTVVTGSQDHVIPFLQAMDIYVLPSLTETSSLSTLEAMSCGVCPVVTRVGSVSKYVKHYQNGVFFAKQNERELAVILNKLLDHQSLREKIGRNARKTVLEDFQWEDTVKQISEILKHFSI